VALRQEVALLAEKVQAHTRNNGTRP
jgi:hypothetical protein